MPIWTNSICLVLSATLSDLEPQFICQSSELWQSICALNFPKPAHM